MLRYALLAAAAALAIPCAGPAQAQGAYGQGAYGRQSGAGQVQSDPGQGGQAYNAQPGAQPDAAADAAPYNGPLNTNQPVVVVAARRVSAPAYARRTTIANVYEIEAGRIALRRSSSPQVREFARHMIRQHSQGLAIIIQASAQAGLPQRPVLDRAHRVMLRRLQRAPARDFDALYLNQQLIAHLGVVALQKGFERYGDNPVLQQAAAQLDPIVQHHLDINWAMTDQPQRLAEQRNTEFAMLDQNTGRGQTYRGYTVIGPTAGEGTNEGASAYGNGDYRGYSNYGGGYGQYQGGQYHGQYQGGQYQGDQYPGDQYQGDQYQGGYYRGSYNGAEANHPYLVPVAYQYPQGGAGATGIPGTGQQGAGQGAGTTAMPGTPGYGTGTTTPGTSYGPSYGPSYGTTTPGASGTYQGYTSPGLGTTTPGTGLGSSPGYTTPGYPGSPGYTAPGMGTTTPSSPGYMTPPTPPGVTGPGA